MGFAGHRKRGTILVYGTFRRCARYLCLMDAIEQCARFFSCAVKPSLSQGRPRKPELGADLAQLIIGLFQHRHTFARTLGFVLELFLPGKIDPIPPFSGRLYSFHGAKTSKRNTTHQNMPPKTPMEGSTTRSQLVARARRVRRLKEAFEAMAR